MSNTITLPDGKVSIPSNGSIQFLLKILCIASVIGMLGLNPLKRVNSILTLDRAFYRKYKNIKVSIPSNGSIQFLPINQYGIYGQWICVSIPSNGSIQFLPKYHKSHYRAIIKSQSPQTGQFNSYDEELKWEQHDPRECLNPLKRVNSILTNEKENTRVFVLSESQSPQTGQFNSYILTIIKDKMKNK